jgi:hypothetical protein
MDGILIDLMFKQLLNMLKTFVINFFKTFEEINV